MKKYSIICSLISLFVITIFTVTCTKTKTSQNQGEILITDSSVFNRIYLSDDSLIAIYKGVQPKFIGYIYKIGNQFQISIHERYGFKRCAFHGNILPIDISKKEIVNIQRQGVYLEFYRNGELHRLSNYKANQLEGTMIELDINGLLENAYILQEGRISNVYKIEKPRK